MVWGRLPPSVRVRSFPVMVVSESELSTAVMTGACPASFGWYGLTPLFPRSIPSPALEKMEFERIAP